MSSLERALVRSVRWLIPGLLLSPLGLLITSHGSLLVFTVHLSLIVVFGLGLTVHLSEFIDDTWFVGWSRFGRSLGAGAAVVVLVTGVVALVTLASSAALHLKPSLQFLQLLSALDIAWSTAALIVGVNWRLGKRYAVAAGVLLSVVCIWSIWRYLSIVGLSPSGGWIVESSALWRYVLPFDLVAAVMALSAFFAGARQPIAQRSPQS